MPFDPRNTPLSAIEARVLATLMEKARTVPDSYPLTLNSLVTGCSVRSTRWEHNFPRGIGVPDQSAVLLALLMLRGPQTAGELRINSERWHRFADISSVEAFLDELRERSEEKGGPLVVQLPRAPGAREQRWAHLLCGPVDVNALAASTGSASTGGNASALQQRVDALETEVAQLRATVQMLCESLGVEPPAASAE